MQLNSLFRQIFQRCPVCLVITAALHATAAYGFSLETGIRHIQRHQNWQSLEFRHPTEGYFIAGRASSKSQDNKAVLNLTSYLSIADKRCNETLELLVELNVPATQDTDRTGILEFQFDNLPARVLNSQVVAEKGNKFVFWKVTDAFNISQLSHHKSLLVNARGMGLAEFSLAGMTSAWRKAKDSCDAFVPR